MFPAVVFSESSVATCLIGLGTNQGDRAANLAAAVKLLAAIPESSIVRQSTNFACQAAVGGALQREFLNAAVLLETALTPGALLAALQQIEDQLGRRRQERWSARQIDLDLLTYNDLRSTAPDLTVPHPRMAFRRFVLVPAAEIAPDYVHSSTGFTVAELLNRLDVLPRRIAITGASSSENKNLAAKAALRVGAVLIDDSSASELGDRFAMLLGSPSGHTAIELVRQQRENIRRLRRRAADAIEIAGTEIAGTWIGEYHALARLALPVVELKAFEGNCSSVKDVDELDRTTVNVVLIVPEENQHTAILQAEIIRLATAPRQAPWLLLDAGDPDWALTEVVAAAEAMR